jgi:hypothetical protein
MRLVDEVGEDLDGCKRVCRHTARLGVQLRRAFPPYSIAGLYDTGAEGGLSQAGNQRQWASTSGGQLAFDIAAFNR